MSQLPVQRALTLLAAASPETPAESLANLSIGQRDARLLTLRELTFGKNFNGLTHCPACNETIELAFAAADLRPAKDAESPAELTLQIEGRDVRFRLPTSGDLLAVGRGEELLSRCLVSGENVFSASARQTISEKMSEADPLADVQLALSCASCGHQWHAAFDIVGFFWRELSATARGLLREVHTLASAYGWTESEILALTPTRRQFYLELLNA